MAVYKIFPHKDATLYSFYPNMNTGIDPVNQISNLNIAVDSNPIVTGKQFIYCHFTYV